MNEVLESYANQNSEASNIGQTPATQESDPTTQIPTKNRQKKAAMTAREEEELADYLDMGMSISEARDMYQKEVEVAEMRLQIRENKKKTLRGSVDVVNRARTGTGSSSTRGRGGLTFN